MANKLQIKRGTTARRLTYIPAAGELVIDTTQNQLYSGNDVTPGGIPIIAEDKTKTLNILPINNGVRYLDLVSRYFTGATVTGALVIHMPAARNTNSTMMTVRISGYNYKDGGGAFDLLCGLYHYGTSGVINTSAALHGSFPSEQVRYAKAADHTVIILGDVNTVWAYPTIRVAEVTTSYSGVIDWENGWSITLDTDLTPYSVKAAPVPYGSSRSKTADALTGGTITGNLSISGTLTNTRFSSTGPYSFLNGASTQSIMTGGILVSSNYVDVSKIPLNGMYVKGNILADGGLTGNASTATKLQNPVTIGISGDLSWSTSFDGSGNVSSGAILSATGITPGTYRSIKVDGKGRALSGEGVVVGLVTATTAASTANTATANTNTYLNVIETVGTSPSTAGTSTQITGVGSVTVASDAAGKLTITGAQSITGNAATATTAVKATTSDSVNSFDNRAIKPNVALKKQLSTYFTSVGGMTGAADTTYADLLILNGYSDTSGGKVNALLLPKGSTSISHYQAAIGDTTWGVPKIIAYTTDNVSSATKLQTARSIGGVAFDGTANINLPGVNTAGNQSTTGNAASATKLLSPRTINGVAFDGTKDILLGETNGLFLGAVQWFGGLRARLPDGYIASDGQLLNRAAFPDLWAVVNSGTYPLITDAVWLANSSKRACYSTGNGTTTFRAPDLNGQQLESERGTFLRGDGGGILADGATSIGTVLGDTIRPVSGFAGGGGHDFNTTPLNNSMTGPFARTDLSGYGVHQAGVGDYGGISFDISRVVPVANEVRPVSSVGVWMIRAIGATSPVPSQGSPATLLANQFNGTQRVVGNLEVTGRVIFDNITDIPLFGVGQTYQDKTAVRIANTVYVNPNNRPMLINIETKPYIVYNNQIFLTASVNSGEPFTFAACNSNAYPVCAGTLVVPPYGTYRININVGEILKWMELS